MVTGADAYGGGSALEVRHLTISFDRVPIIKDVSFTVAAGDSLAIIGPTGSGKTVLFRALIGALPYEGEIRWAPGATVGYVPQKLDIERDLPITGNDFLLGKAPLRVPQPSRTWLCLALESLFYSTFTRCWVGLRCYCLAPS